MDKILIVDDEAKIRNLFRKVLARENYKIFTAPSGEKAVSITKKEKPDVILLDLKMPGIGGMEALKRIKKINDKIIVIVITGYGTTETATEAMKLGAHDHLSKPFDLNKVRISIKEAMEIHRLSKEVAELRGKLKTNKKRS